MKIAYFYMIDLITGLKKIALSFHCCKQIVYKHLSIFIATFGAQGCYYCLGLVDCCKLFENELASSCFSAVLVATITNSSCRNSKVGIIFPQGRTVKNGHDSIFTSSFAESQTCCGCMGNDITANWLGRVLGKTHSIRIGNHLISNEDSNTELFSEPCELS